MQCLLCILLTKIIIQPLSLFKENKIKKKFQVQLAMAKVLQDAILKNVTVYGKGHVLQEAIEFSEVFEKVFIYN